MSVALGKKTVLITGCSPGGIGHALCEEFHAKGLHVIATARDAAVLSDLKAMGMTTLSFEVTNNDNVKAIKEEVEKLTGGKLDILVNNAGKNYTVPAVDVDLDEARHTFETNFFSVVAITQAFTPLLVASKGLIINIGSVAGIMPYAYGAIYNATKAALHSYSNTLRLELEPYDVSVMVVVTGGVQSNIARTQRDLPEGSLYLPINKEYKERLTHSQQGAMSHDVYAKGVVAAALKPKPTKWLWRGNRTLLIWFLQRFFGIEVFDRIFPRMFGLDKLKAIVRSRATSKKVV